MRGKRARHGETSSASQGNPWVPLMLVLLSLLGLVVVPTMTQRRVESLRTKNVDVTAPAQRLIGRIQSEMAMELVATRAYLPTGDPRFAADYLNARAHKNAALSQLLSLSSELDADVRPDVEALRRRLAESEPLLDDLFAGRISRSQYIARLPERHALFREQLEQLERVGEEFFELEQERRAQVGRVMRWGFRGEIFLVVLTLVAASYVAMLGRRHRLLALRLERYSRSQTALREAASALGEATTARQVTHIAAERALDVVEASGAYVEHVEETGRKPAVVASCGREGPRAGARLPVPSLGWPSQSEAREARVVDRIDERLSPYLPHSNELVGLVSPLFDEHVACSLVLLRQKSERKFTADDVAAARSLSDLTSAALRRVAALKALTDSERRLREVTDHLEQVIWLGPPDRNERDFVSPASETLLGVAPDDFKRDPDLLFLKIHPDDRERVAQALRNFPTKRSDERFRVKHPDGRIAWILARHYPIRDEDGQVRRVAGIMEDITGLKAAEDERECLLERERRARADADARRLELERATRSRTRLIRGFSHDLKNPLGVADSQLQLLLRQKRAPLSAGQRERVRRVRKSLRTAFDLIESLLALAKAQTGALELELAPTDLREVLVACAEEYAPQAETAGLELRTSLPAHGFLVTTDPNRVRQILGNLLSNAVKYTDEGHVTLGLTGPEDGRVGLCVNDTGRGLSKESQEHVFEEFRRMQGAEDQSGAGIGLAIAQAVAHALGGEITVESELGAGSTFTLWLPMGAHQRQAADKAGPTLH